MAIPENIITEIRQRADIVGIICQYVHLRQRGKNFVGLCPFHTEKTPSFYVSPELGIYKCFGCGKSGDVFTFLMEHCGMSFREALQYVANDLGIEFPRSNEEDTHNQFRRTLRTLLNDIATYFREQLKLPHGRIAQEFLHKRAISEQMQQKFKLGYAPDDWSAMTDTFLQRGWTLETLKHAGVCQIRDDGSAYDLFRNRLMFPIENIRGDVIGFGGRTLSKDPHQPKYINSPQSVLYDKSSTLYGLNHARSSIIRKQHVLVVEGYLDAIALHQIGIDYTVATAGTALTQQHLAILRRLTERIIVVFDGDQAGYQAASRAVIAALQSGFAIKVVLLPEGEDPDSLVRNRGNDAMHRLLSQSKTALEFLIEFSKLRYNWDEPHTAYRQIRTITDIVATVPDSLYRELLLRELSDRVGIRQELLAPTVTQSSISSKSLRTVPPPIAELSTSSHQLVFRLNPEEATILRASLFSRRLADDIFNEYLLDPDTLPSPLARRLLASIQQYCQDNPSNPEPPGRLLSSMNLDRELQELAEWLMFTDESPSARWSETTGVEFDPQDRYPREIADAILKLEERRIELSIAELHEQLARKPDDVQVLEQIDKLHKLRIQLRSQLTR